MGFRFGGTTNIIVLSLALTFQMLHVCSATEFEAGGNRGWIVPPPPPPGTGTNATAADDYYTHWACQMRFKVGDTLRFKYKKDSVMEVREGDYKECKATQPISFSNTGNTVVNLNRSGYFYFISGASGHCQKGQKLVVKVMAPPAAADSSAPPISVLTATGGGGGSLVVLLLAIMAVHFLILSSSCFF